MKKQTLKLIFAAIILISQSFAQVGRTAVYNMWKNRIVPTTPSITSTWASFHNISDDGRAWVTKGQAIGTNTAFIGSTDNFDWLGKSNNITRFKIGANGINTFYADSNTFNIPFVLEGGRTVNSANPYMQLKGYYIGAYRILNTTTGREWFMSNMSYGSELDYFSIGRTSNPSTAYFKIDTSGSVFSQGKTDVTKDNIYYGKACGTTTTNGIENAVFGLSSANTQTAGNGNSIFGTYSARAFKSAGQNCVFGSDAIAQATITSGNNVMGVQALSSYTGVGYNVAIGLQSMRNVITGSNNIGIGYRAAETLTAGSNNVFIGNSITSPSTTLNNNIIISDGAGNIQYRWDGSKNTFTNAIAVGNTNTVVTGNSGTIAVVTDMMFTTTHFHSLASSVGTATLHFSQSFAGTCSASNNGCGITYLPYDCTLVGYSYSNAVFGTLGTANNATVYVRIDNTTDVLLNNTVLFSTLKQNYTASNLNTNVNAGSYVEIKVLTNNNPTAATNVSEAVTLYWKRR